MGALHLPAIIGLTAAVAIAAPYDITTPSDPITPDSSFTVLPGDTDPSPDGEDVTHALDNRTDKYLNFGGPGAGFIVNPASNEVVNGLRFYTANDADERDPASFVFEGSNDGTVWTQISSGGLDLPTGRNIAGLDIDPVTQFNQFVPVSNSLAYDQYRLRFPTIRDVEGGAPMQIGEVELVTAVPEPSCLGVLSVGGILAIRRQRHA